MILLFPFLFSFSSPTHALDLSKVEESTNVIDSRGVKMDPDTAATGNAIYYSRRADEDFRLSEEIARKAQTGTAAEREEGRQQSNQIYDQSQKWREAAQREIAKIGQKK